MAAALMLVLATAAAAALAVQDLARRDNGDVFTITDNECGPSQCASRGAGAISSADGGGCACACPPRAPLFREDREVCVDDLPECSLATFGTGNGVQRIPFVFLPLRGQIIHPSREINFEDVKTPICAISGAQFLTRKGFVDLRNTLDADVPFTLFRDEGKTFLQWSGEEEVRKRMSGRVMVVRLLCRDVTATPSSPMDLRGVFTPCVAFRVQGTPPRQLSNVTEVQFAPNAHTAEAAAHTGLSVTEYVAIGISSLLLGSIYVASVFLYLHIRRRRKIESEKNNARKFKGLTKKDGTAITEHDIVRINNERLQTISKTIDLDEGVVKKNPLLTMNRQFHDTKGGFSSDTGNSLSDSDDYHDINNSRNENDVMYTQQTTSVVIHPHHGELKIRKNLHEQNYRDEPSIERLPDEHVSIVETTDEDIVRPVGTTRRKLYFNPSYFEPHLMADPPPAALEFLIKIREVISIAKHKMAAKRFQPVLNLIPEEETYASNNAELYQGLGSQRSGSVISLKRENSRKKNCIGCPGCKRNIDIDIQNIIKQEIPACSNCSNKGEKQNTIQKWLENIPTGKSLISNNDLMPNNIQNNLVNSLRSLTNNERSRNKVKKQNSFSATRSLYPDDNNHNKCSTLSVKSEPAIRRYNIPLPEFNNIDFMHNPYNYFENTVTPTDDIRHIGSDNPNESLRKFRRNKSKLPDMVNEAIALDHFSKSYVHTSSDEDKITKENSKLHSRNRCESPLGNDYETDSLERTSNKKRCINSDYLDTPSSQASPCLSNALPLEEELTMRNAIYKQQSSSNSNTPSPQREIFIEQDHYETIGSKKNLQHAQRSFNSNSNYTLVSEVYVNSYNFGSTPTSPSGSDCSLDIRKNIKIANDEKPGCLTIEVKDSPENYIKIHESDGFEPDTLDRKHSKNKEPDPDKSDSHFSRKSLLKNIEDESSSKTQQGHSTNPNTNILSTINNQQDSNNKILSLNNLQVNNDSIILSLPSYCNTKDNLSELNKKEETDDIWEDAPEWQTEDGRVLTLELRHSKRQRQLTPPSINNLKKLARPDILPPLPPGNEICIYDQPAYPPKKINIEMNQVDGNSKNVNDRSLIPKTFTKNTIMFNSSATNVIQSSLSSASVSKKLMDCENKQMNNLQNLVLKKGERNESMKTLGKRRLGCCQDNINTNTYIKGPREGAITKQRYRRKKGTAKEDSGYLSSDSANSRRFLKKLVIAKIVSCSESDDTENEARSESGAESVETHSVYFGSFRKLQMNLVNTQKT